MTSLRYSQPKFRTTLAVAAALTAMVSGTAWMLLNAFNFAHADFYAGLTALVFFAFMSATMILRYVRNEVVLAVLPTGLFDARWQSEAVAWERIREVVARRRENEVELDVYLWRPQRDAATRVPDHVIELAPLEGDAGPTVEAIARHVRLRVDAPMERAQLDHVAGENA